MSLNILKKTIFISFLFLLIYPFEKSAFSSEETQNILSFRATNLGKVELIKLLIGSSQDIVKNFLQKGGAFDDKTLEFGATDEKKCRALINDYNNSRTTLETLWTTCPGLPDAFFDYDRNLYNGLWTYTPEILNTVPRPLSVKLANITLNKIEFMEPMISCVESSCTVTLGINDFDVSAKLFMEQLLLKEGNAKKNVLSIPDLRLILKKSRIDTPKLVITFDFVEALHGEKPLLSLNEKRSFIHLPRDTFKVTFRGANQSILRLLKRSGAVISYDDNIRLKIYLAKKFMDMGQWSGFLNVDASIMDFFAVDENIKTINNLLFPFIGKTMEGFVTKNPFFAGKAQKFEVGKFPLTFKSSLIRGQNENSEVFHDISVVRIKENPLPASKVIAPFVKMQDADLAVHFNFLTMNTLFRDLYDAKELNFKVKEEILKNYPKLYGEGIKEISGEFLDCPQIEFDESTKRLSIQIHGEYRYKNNEPHQINEKLSAGIILRNDGIYEIVYDLPQGDILEDEIFQIFQKVILSYIPGLTQVLDGLKKDLGISDDDPQDSGELPVLIKDYVLNKDFCEVKIGVKN